MKPKLYLLLVSFIFVFTHQNTNATSASKDISAIETNNAILGTADLDGFEHKIVSVQGRYILPPKEKPNSKVGLEQKAVFQGVKVSIWYAEFPTSEDAREALDICIKTSSWVMKKGLWTDTQAKDLGDEVYSFALGADALYVRVGQTLVIVNCPRKDKQVAVMVAAKIVEKIRKGARVILPPDVPKR